MIDKDAIKARLANATPGPWKVGYSTDPECPGTSINGTYDCVIEPSGYLATDDAIFIANAPTDVADLLEEVERLEGEVGKFKECTSSEPTCPGTTWSTGKGIAGWQETQLSCNYCGSLHPDVFMEQLENGATVVPTDKSYKAYLRVASGSEAKFYYEHLSDDQKNRFIELCNQKKLIIGYPGYFYVVPYFMQVIEKKELKNG